MIETMDVLDARALRRALMVTDLTDPACGAHAMQLLVAGAVDALISAWGCSVIHERASPIVSIADNYDRLHYRADGAARDARHTRYVCETALLRTQTSAMIPRLLRRVSAAPPSDVLLVCPGLVYRRDCIDRLHTGEPHQLDLWRVSRVKPLAVVDLQVMIRLVLDALLPGREWKLTPSEHPYTLDGLQIDVRNEGRWVEIGECGRALPDVLAENAHAGAYGLAMGLGLDRILMLSKGVDDIRLLRASDPRIASQMQDLTPYRPVSSMPAVKRDLSIAVGADSTLEELGDKVRAALGPEATIVESIELVSEVPYEALPEPARARLGIVPGQKNLLLRVVLRALDRTLTHQQCNETRDQIYASLHEGSIHHWAAR